MLNDNSGTKFLCGNPAKSIASRRQVFLKGFALTLIWMAGLLEPRGITWAQGPLQPAERRVIPVAANLPQETAPAAPPQSSPIAPQPGVVESLSDGTGTPANQSTGNGGSLTDGLGNFPNNYFAETDTASHGQLNFNDFPRELTEGLAIRNNRWLAKISGYVKADLIRDFRAIDSTDSFDPSTIPVGSPQRTNSRFHVRQTRLNFDARWHPDNLDQPLRVFVEGDFFGDGDTFRLRHAYGEYSEFIVGQTWTTLTHRAALPNTLDIVGDVASVSRRQAQVRWTRKFWDERLAFAAAIEDAPVSADTSVLTFGSPRSILPDSIARLRYTMESAEFQLAVIVRRMGFQPTGHSVLRFNGAGLNSTGFYDMTENNRFYGGIFWGSGVGSYRELPDLAQFSATEGVALESLSWYSGLHHKWNARWFSNVTYSRGNVTNSPLQPLDSIHTLEYLSVNLVWQPTQRSFIGAEGLWGLRENRDGAEQDASRLMLSFGFILP